MQYYKEHININDLDILNENIKFGKLLYNDNKYFINNDINEILINNRGIIDDEVYIKDNEIIGIKNRNIKNIVGILYLDSKIKYGSVKDKTLFLFKPTNKQYPNFYIPYKNNNINKKIYVIIHFKEWKITDKLPIGTLMDIIGNVGEKEIEYEHLRNYYNIKNNTWKKDYKNDIENLNKLDVVDYTVFSIDPKGSKDIDDAFHFLEIEENVYEIGIHIASPYIFFKNDLETILNRVSTIYLPEKKYNMLPNIYADNLLSLLENKKRHAISLILKINNFHIEEYEIKKSIVLNIKNYDYDTFDIVYKNIDNLNGFFNYSKIYFKENDIFDSHKLVENWMIFTNKFIAKYLIESNISNIILRKYENTNNIINNINIDLKLLKYLNIKNEKSALYEIYDNTNEHQKHYKLGNEYYTHFTSPIRRAIDLYIHSLILDKDNTVNKDKLQNYIDYINIFTKNSRKFDRNIRRLEFLYNSKKHQENILTYGYIIDINDYRIKIYIPEYNLEEKIIIVPYKFKNIAIIDLYKNENNNIYKIEYIIDNEKKIYELYEKLNLKLWIFTSFDNIFDKLKIEIV